MNSDEQQNELATAYYNRGNIYFENGDYDKAIADYTPKRYCEIKIMKL